MNHFGSVQELCESLFRQETEAYISSVATLGLEVQLQHRVSESEDSSSIAMMSSQRKAHSLQQMHSPIQDTDLSEVPTHPAPLCRIFWKAGDYDNLSSESVVPNTNSYLHVHPKFLHSNATSHKWAFGAVAELIDNAIDEIQNGATFVWVDKVSDPRVNFPALLIQDDGGGMNPEAIRRCMSFGFSNKTSAKAIGRYGNGFKTSTMRLGADAMIFSRKMDNGTFTQSIGLLSYTYLCCTGMDRIVIPMIDYEYMTSTATWKPLYWDIKENFQSNMSSILQWSPCPTEAELLKQFDDMGSHGTKIIIFNLWFADDGTLELDFDSDPEDIRLKGSDIKKNSKMLATEEHIGNQYRYSLRMYLSILYLKLPKDFVIMLRGKVVEHRIIARDLKFPEFIVYRPRRREIKEGDIITTIGFLKEAPDVNIHGFNIYHRNRLILPFWPVVSSSHGKGRGVVGVLEANFVEPAHNKQDFERTSLFQRLESRLKDMTLEYWDYHCGLAGYHVQKKIPASLPKSPLDCPQKTAPQPVGPDNNSSSDPVDESDPIIPIGSVSRSEDQQLDPKRKISRPLPTSDVTTTESFNRIQLPNFDVVEQSKQEAAFMMQTHMKFREKCLEYLKSQEQLIQKVSLLRKELEEERTRYYMMLLELQVLEAV